IATLAPTACSHLRRTAGSFFAIASSSSPGRSPVPESSRTAAPKTSVWDWGDLRRLRPVSRTFGYDRGLPVDRYYIESFLERNRRDIDGRTLEIGDDEYTRRFGGER